MRARSRARSTRDARSRRSTARRSAERVVTVRVEAGRHQHPRRARIGPTPEPTTSSSARASTSPVAPAGSGTLTVSPRASGAAGLVEGAGPGIEAILVSRDVTDAIVVPEQRLRAVAVVHVPVDDDHALARLRQRGGGDRHVVDQTEAHRPVGERVMPGRSGDDERDVAVTRCRARRSRPARRRPPRELRPRTHGPAYVSGSSLTAARHRRTLRARGDTQRRAPP